MTATPGPGGTGPGAPPGGRLIVLAGPSGVGKSSVVSRLRDALPQLHVSVSVTTREPRPGEVDGVDYRFVSLPEFDQMVELGELLEWAEIHGGLQRSGTPGAPVRAALTGGVPVLAEVDVQGARAIKAALPAAVTVFLEPPSLTEMARRLRGRGTESQDQVERRLETARVEMAARSEFDVAIVNDDLQVVVERLVELLVGPADPGGSQPIGHRSPAAGPSPPGFPAATRPRALPVDVRQEYP